MGLPVKDIAQQPGISKATFFDSKVKFGRMETSNIARKKKLERRNAKLKYLYVKAGIEIRLPKNLIEKIVTPEKKRKKRKCSSQHIECNSLLSNISHVI